jgi:hypothetical protein
MRPAMTTAKSEQSQRWIEKCEAVFGPMVKMKTWSGTSNKSAAPGRGFAAPQPSLSTYRVCGAPCTSRKRRRDTSAVE